jgi:hypothetical protein
MALSDTHLTTVSQILSISPIELAGQITWLGTHLTPTIQTAIEAQITLWDAGAAINFTDIEPNVKNFGAKISAGSARAMIAKNIAILLERPDWAGSSGVTSRVERG